jgi:integration host factor subunit beta
MNKRELVAAAARRTPLTQRQVRQALDALLEAITDALTEGEPVALSDFGRFLVQSYPGRRLRRFDGAGNCVVEDRRVPVFRSSAALRRRVKEKDS